MKDAHISLRIPAELDRELEARAARDSLPKSTVVREAMTRYLVPDSAPTPRPSAEQLGPTASSLAERWPSLPHLAPEDAAAFAADVECAVNDLPPAVPPWE